MAHTKETAVKIIPALGKLAKRVVRVIKERRVVPAAKKFAKRVLHRVITGTSRK